MAQMLRRASTPLQRDFCCKCGAAYLRPEKDTPIGTGRCVGECAEAASNLEVAVEGGAQHQRTPGSSGKAQVGEGQQKSGDDVRLQETSMRAGDEADQGVTMLQTKESKICDLQWEKQARAEQQRVRAERRTPEERAKSEEVIGGDEQRRADSGVIKGRPSRGCESGKSAGCSMGRAAEHMAGGPQMEKQQVKGEQIQRQPRTGKVSGVKRAAPGQKRMTELFDRMPVFVRLDFF